MKKLLKSEPELREAIENLQKCADFLNRCNKNHDHHREVIRLMDQIDCLRWVLGEEEE